MKNNKYVKIHGPSINNDWDRVNILYDICEKIDKVETSIPIRKNQHKKAIEYDYIHFPPNIIKYINTPDIWKRVAIALCKIHNIEINYEKYRVNKQPYPLQELGLSNTESEYLNKFLPICWFHGDFWYGNVFVESENTVIVIDPIPSQHLFSSKYFFSSVAVDVAMMYMSILIVHPLHRQIYIDIKKHICAAETFLTTYLEEIGCKDEQTVLIIRKLAKFLAIKHTDAYRNRLLYPLAVVKTYFSSKMINLMLTQK